MVNIMDNSQVFHTSVAASALRYCIFIKYLITYVSVELMMMLTLLIALLYVELQTF